MFVEQGNDIHQGETSFFRPYVHLFVWTIWIGAFNRPQYGYICVIQLCTPLMVWGGGTAAMAWYTSVDFNCTIKTDHCIRSDARCLWWNALYCYAIMESILAIVLMGDQLFVGCAVCGHSWSCNTNSWLQTSSMFFVYYSEFSLLGAIFNEEYCLLH